MDGVGSRFTWDEKLGQSDQNGNVLYKSVRRGAERFNLYDNILTIPTEGSKFPLAKIMKLWENEGGKQMVIRWYYNLEDARAVGYRGRKIPDHEMFLAMGESGGNGVEDPNPLEIINRKATVLNLSANCGNLQPSKDDIAVADKVFRYALHMLHLEKCVPIEEVLLEIVEEAAFNKREWLKSVVSKATHGGMDDELASLGGKAGGEEVVERKKRQRLVHVIHEDIEKRGGSKAGRGVHGRLVDMCVEPLAEKCLRGLKQKADAPMPLEAEGSSRERMGREGAKNCGGALREKPWATSSLVDKGIQHDEEGTAMPTRGRGTGKKPLIKRNNFQSDEVDTVGVRTSINARSDAARHCGKVLNTAVALSRAPAVNGKIQFALNTDKNLVKSSFCRTREPNRGSRGTREVVPSATSGRALMETTHPTGPSRETLCEGVSRVLTQPTISIKRDCVPLNDLGHTSKYTSFDLLLLAVVADTERDLGSISAIAAKELKLAMVGGEPNFKCDTWRQF